MDARETALSVLRACRRGGAWSDLGLKAALDKSGLDRRDAALASRICYGVIQNEALLDHYLAAFSSRPLDKLEPALPDILRIGAYQLLFMDRIPDTAAVNEAVTMAKRHASVKAAGFVNGVLRTLAAHKDALPPIPQEDRNAYLSIRYSHPLWLVERMSALLGAETEAFLRCSNEPAPLTARVNRLKSDTDTLIGELRDEDIEAARHPWLPDSVLLPGGDIRGVRAFEEGKLFVQDAAATLAVLAAGAKPGDTVLDVCGAPGGKSFALASALGGACRIVTRDLHPNKVRLIADGAKRLGMETVIAAEQADAREAREEDRERFDLVIVDAPCSGLGIIRKKPDIRAKRPEDIAPLPAIQLAILSAASKAVKPGGTLLYATCTILPEENEDVVGAFTASDGRFAPAAFTLPGPAGSVPTGMLTLWPQIHGTDGFFICRLKRTF